MSGPTPVVAVINATALPLIVNEAVLAPGATSAPLILGAGIKSVILRSTAAGAATQNVVTVLPFTVRAGVAGTFPWAYAAPYDALPFADVVVTTMASSGKTDSGQTVDFVATKITVSSAVNSGWIGVTPSITISGPNVTGVFQSQPNLPLVPSAPFAIVAKSSSKTCVAGWSCDAAPTWSNAPNGPFVQLIARGSAYVLAYVASGGVTSYFSAVGSPGPSTIKRATLACTPDISLALPVTVLQDAQGQASGKGGVVLVFTDANNGQWVLDPAAMCVSGDTATVALTQLSLTDFKSLPGFAFVPGSSAGSAETVYLQLPPASTLASRVADKTLDCCATINAGCADNQATCALTSTPTGKYLCPGSSYNCPKPSSGSNPSGGAIAGIVIGSAAFVAAIVLIGYYGHKAYLEKKANRVTFGR